MGQGSMFRVTACTRDRIRLRRGRSGARSDCSYDIASILYNDQSMAPTPGPVDHFVYNAVGHTVALTDEAGAVTQASLYEAFGTVVASGGSGSTNNRLANTKERDASLGLDNHGFRYYDPASGRYISRDPIGYGDGMNVYASVHNNPINGVDPVGLAGRVVNGYEVDETLGGHHKVPVEVWEETGLHPDALKTWDEARAMQPEGTGHTYRGHGPKTGYTAHVTKLVREHLARFMAEHGVNGALTVEQQKAFAGAIIERIDAMPEDSAIGGYLKAVREGGDAGVKRWSAGPAKEIPAADLSGTPSAKTHTPSSASPRAASAAQAATGGAKAVKTLRSVVGILGWVSEGLSVAADVVEEQRATGHGWWTSLKDAIRDRAKEESSKPFLGPGMWNPTYRPSGKLQA